MKDSNENQGCMITKEPVHIAIDMINMYGSIADKNTLEQIQTCMEITGEEEIAAILHLNEKVKINMSMNDWKTSLKGTLNQLVELKKSDVARLKTMRNSYNSPNIHQQDKWELRTAILTLTGMMELYNKQANSILNFLRNGGIELPEFDWDKLTESDD